jgi:hypothetical protein
MHAFPLLGQLVPRNVVKLTDPPRRAKTEIGVFGVDDAKVFLKACRESPAWRSV